MKAVVALLLADSTLTAMLSATTAIYTRGGVPEGTAPPYIIVEDPRETRADTFGTTGKEVRLDINAWSIYKGTKEIGQIANQIASTLDRTTLTITGHTTAGCTHEETDTFEESDKLQRASLEFLIHTQEA